MSLGTVLEIVGLLSLGLFFLLEASGKIKLHWGRRGTELPLTLAQQKLIGATFGAAMLVLAAAVSLRAIRPGSIGDAKWDHLKVLVLASGGAVTWISALLDSRIKNIVRASWGGDSCYG